MGKKLSQEEFLAKCLEVHGDLYDYRDTVFKNTRSPIKVICPIHGVFSIIPNKHLHGKRGCQKCGRDSQSNKVKMSNEEFVQRAHQVHSHKYQYVSEYKGSEHSVDVICPTHGMFTQNAGSHVIGKGCPQCADHTKFQSKSAESFFLECEKVHNGRYTYPEKIYNGCLSEISANCPYHGGFRITATNHLSGMGCPNCSLSNRITKITRTQQQFIQMAETAHGGKYAYTNSVYRHGNVKVAVTCPYHGDFLITPNNHLSGSGCPDCGVRGSYTDKIFDKRPDLRDTKIELYFLHFKSDDDEFCKIGLSRNTDLRIRSYPKSQYTIEKLRIVEMYMDDAIKLETSILQKWADKSYTPMIKFSGYTECFTSDCICDINATIAGFSNRGNI